MTDVYFISEEVLKNRTAINENVDSGELRFCIQTAQNLNIQETLGQALFEQIVNEVSGNTIAGSNKYLLDNYIVNATIAWSYYHGLDNFFVKWMNVGLVANRTEQGSNIDFKTFQYLKTDAKQQAEFNDNLLRRPLIFRSGLYPEYNNGNLNDGQLPPIPASPFQSAITIPTSAYAWGRGWRLGNCGNAMGPLCAVSPFPTWYGRATNSPGVQ